VDKYFGSEHLHFLDTPDGDRICIDIERFDGVVFSIGWYTMHRKDSGREMFETLLGGSK
jgi:hypothetical protein